ncbi:MAG: TonB-dependent receptor plug domain-containing protein [bacterium]
MFMRCRLFFWVLIMGAVACASSTETKSARRSTRVITAEEIATTSATNAYEAVQLLRPHLLQRQFHRQTSLSSPGPITAIVYVDGVRYGDLQSLNTLSTENISEIRYIDSREATLRYGADHGGGAFMVKTK